MSEQPHTGPPESLPRDERRRRTEVAILEAARQQFAEQGYERATIRGVAAAAGVDPALVMQHYGSKEALFAAAARWPSEHERIKRAGPADLPHAALADVFDRFELAEDREAAIALTRSCLTHPGAAAVMRDEVMCDRMGAVAAALEGDDAELRAALLGACMIGLSMTRYLLALEPLASMPVEDLVGSVAPVLQRYLDGPLP